MGIKLGLRFLFAKALELQGFADLLRK